MSTRSITRVFDCKDQIIAMYRQCDGYPSGIGSELAEFLSGMKITNGIAVGRDTGRTANGAGCLAAQIVAHFKNGVGGVYLYPTKIKDAGQEYEYHITVSSALSVSVAVYDTSETQKQKLFEGTVKDFALFCEDSTC